MTAAADTERMARALELAASVRASTPPNPWVGCVIEAADGTVFEGATQPVGGPHAEAAALGGGRRARPRGRDRVGHARAVLAPRPHPAVRRRAHRAPASAVWSSRSRIPTRRWRDGGSPGSGTRGSPSTSGVAEAAAASLLRAVPRTIAAPADPSSC